MRGRGCLQAPTLRPVLTNTAVTFHGHCFSTRMCVEFPPIPKLPFLADKKYVPLPGEEEMKHFSAL